MRLDLRDTCCPHFVPYRREARMRRQVILRNDCDTTAGQSGVEPSFVDDLKAMRFQDRTERRSIRGDVTTAQSRFRVRRQQVDELDVLAETFLGEQTEEIARHI